MEELHELLSTRSTFLDIDSQTYEALYHSNPFPNENWKFRLIVMPLDRTCSTVLGYHFNGSVISSKHFQKKVFKQTARLREVIDHLLKFYNNEFGFLGFPEDIEASLSLFNSTINTTMEPQNPVNETNNSLVAQNLSVNVRSHENQVNPRPKSPSFMSIAVEDLSQTPLKEAEVNGSDFF